MEGSPDSSLTPLRCSLCYNNNLVKITGRIAEEFRAEQRDANSEFSDLGGLNLLLTSLRRSLIYDNNVVEIAARVVEKFRAEQRVSCMSRRILN
nr:hypothetical protein Iba_chr03dCG7450 [Ipomoea batatas]